MKHLNRIVAAVAFFATTFLFTACGGESFTDPRDGQKYKTVKIGDQVWMAENLKYKAGAQTVDEEGSSFVWDSALVACPEGWHLPSKEELESISSDTNFYNIWSSTEKEDFSTAAYNRWGRSISTRDKNPSNATPYVRCVQGDGTKQPRLSEYKGYKAIRIGSQIWMKDYLTIESPNSVCYLDDSEECSKGRYYPYSEAMNICPEGWHLPSKSEAAKYINTLKKEGAGLKSTRGYYDVKRESFETSLSESIFWTNSFGYAVIDWYSRNNLKVDEFYEIKEGQWKLAVRCIADTEDKKEE
jgi:hypothetical protein